MGERCVAENLEQDFKTSDVAMSSLCKVPRTRHYNDSPSDHRRKARTEECGIAKIGFRASTVVPSSKALPNSSDDMIFFLCVWKENALLYWSESFPAV